MNIVFTDPMKQPAVSHVSEISVDNLTAQEIAEMIEYQEGRGLEYHFTKEETIKNND